MDKKYNDLLFEYIKSTWENAIEDPFKLRPIFAQASYITTNISDDIITATFYDKDNNTLNELTNYIFLYTMGELNEYIKKRRSDKIHELVSVPLDIICKK